MIDTSGMDYWDIIEAALVGLPESDGLRAPALAAFDHLKERVQSDDPKPGHTKPKGKT